MWSLTWWCCNSEWMSHCLLNSLGTILRARMNDPTERSKYTASSSPTLNVTAGHKSSIQQGVEGWGVGGGGGGYGVGEAGEDDSPEACFLLFPQLHVPLHHLQNMLGLRLRQPWQVQLTAHLSGLRPGPGHGGVEKCGQRHKNELVYIYMSNSQKKIKAFHVRIMTT